MQTDTVIIGGGQAGLAMSRALTRRGVENVVLERGRVGERWRTERWESLTLLTPSWLSRLPDDVAPPGHPEDFLSRADVVAYLERYATPIGADLVRGCTVERVGRAPNGYRIDTDRGTWEAPRVVIATGESQDARIPSWNRGLSADVAQIAPTRYRGPGSLPTGGVLVVGASATGVQLAAEIHASGRPVTLAVGRHTRLPRTYRGRDILWWFDRLGMLDQRAADVPDLATSRRQPSMQLTGTPDCRGLDLAVLAARGVRLVGRAVGARGLDVRFNDDLDETTAAADFKLGRLRQRIDAAIQRSGSTVQVVGPEPFVPVRTGPAPTRLNLADEGIRTVVWATGFSRSYSWLDVPVLDARGELQHRGGLTPAPGLFALGLNFMRRRSSSFIRGAGRDAVELAHIIRRQRSDAASTLALAGTS